MTFTATPRTAPEPAAGGPSSRNGRWSGSLVGLVTALAAAGTLIAPPGPPRRTARAGDVDRRPGVARGPARRYPGGSADGPAYNPVFFLDARTSLGTAPRADGTHLRLVLRSAPGALRELRRLRIAGNPQYGGFTLSGDKFAWAESTRDDSGKGRTEMWLAGLKSDLPPAASPRKPTTSSSSTPSTTC